MTFGNETENGGRLSTVYARKEVILAAGALGSAPILERSGVGNSAYVLSNINISSTTYRTVYSVLKKAGIKQRVNLPGVGMNLNDQPGTSASATVLSSAASNTSIIDGRNLFAPDISLVNIDEIFTSGKRVVSPIIIIIMINLQQLRSYRCRHHRILPLLPFLHPQTRQSTLHLGSSRLHLLRHAHPHRRHLPHRQSPLPAPHRRIHWRILSRRLNSCMVAPPPVVQGFRAHEVERAV